MELFERKHLCKVFLHNQEYQFDKSLGIKFFGSIDEPFLEVDWQLGDILVLMIRNLRGELDGDWEI